MSFIRTVLFDIPPSELGVCYAHEHVIIDPGIPTWTNPDFLLDSVETAIEELRAFHGAGGRAVIDSMPCDAGRNAIKLAQVARGTGVHIVAATGLHLPKYYHPGHWGNEYPAHKLLRLFVEDIEEGIDTHDYSGPILERTPYRAGVIKIATGETITAREERALTAAAQAHVATGCPILTHTEQGRLALQQIGHLRREGVDLKHVCLSHTDRNPDVGYHRDILATGVRVEYDSGFRWKQADGNPTLDLCVELIPEFPDQIMLGMDAARRTYWTSYGGSPGLTFLLTQFTEQLKDAGIPDDLLHRVFVTNPAATFAFAEPAAP